MNNSYSISTAWNIEKDKSAQDIIKEIENANFSQIELNFAITSALLKELTNIILKKDLQITSIHNYCPVPEEAGGNISPDYFSLASLDENEREKGVEYTKRTIDTAANLSAKAVVLHCGRVEMGNCYSRKLIKLYKEGKAFSDEYKQIIFEMTEERKQKSRPYLESAIKSIKELASYAKRRNVSIGIETRYYYQEIPQFEEFEKIFDSVPEPNLFYWHDSGHAQCAQNLGITSHVAYLKRYSYKMIGVHLHDTEGTQDHRLPGEGDLNFKILRPYINSKTVKVLEPHPPVDVEKLRKSVKYLDRILNSSNEA